MKKFFNFIVDKKYLVLGFFIIMLCLSLYGYTFVKTNGDVTSYLDEDTETSNGKKMLEDEFKIMGDAAIAIKGISKEELKAFTEYIEAEKLVKNVVWIGRFGDIEDVLNDPTVPDNIKNEMNISYENLKNKFYNKENDISVVSVYFTESSSSDAVIDVINSIENKLKTLDIDEFAMNGTAVNARNLLDSSIGDIPKFILVAVIAIFIILLLTSKSYIEPIIFLATLGISILLNMGTNIILGTVSSITFSASTILQLALAMDYAVFLMHSYNEELKTNVNPVEAMKAALPRTLKSILASALTTIGGFVALFSMQFGMGYDLGVVLAKGVALSLVTVITLQPVLILIFNKAIQKTQHKDIKADFSFLNKISDKFKKSTVVIALLLVIPSFIFQYFVDNSFLTMTEPKSEVTVTEEFLEDSSNQIIMMVPYDRYSQFEKGYIFLEKLKARNDINDIFTLGTIVPKDTFAVAMISPDRAKLLDELEKNFVSGKKNSSNKKYVLYIINLNSHPESEESYNSLKEIKSLAVESMGECYTTGLTQGAYDLSLITMKDFIKVSILSALIILIILLFGFKSIKLSLILLLVIELGIWINLSITYFIGLEINFMAYIIISAIQLGATVDYAIMLTYRYRAELKKGLNMSEAMNVAIVKVGPSITVSAAILIFTCVGVKMVTSNLIVSQITELIARGALLSLVLVLVLLPSIIKVFHEFNKRKIDKKERYERKEILEKQKALLESKNIIKKAQ